MINYIKNLFKRKYTYRKGEFTLRTKIDGMYKYYHSPTQQWLTWLVIMDDTEYMSEAELLSGTLLDMSQYQRNIVVDSTGGISLEDNRPTVSFNKCVVESGSDVPTIKDLREDLHQTRKDDTPVNVSSSYTPSYDSYDSSNYSSYSSSSSSSSSYNSSSYDSGSCSSYSSSSSGGCD